MVIFYAFKQNNQWLINISLLPLSHLDKTADYFIFTYAKAVAKFGSPTQHLQKQLDSLKEVFKLPFGYYACFSDHVQMVHNNPQVLHHNRVDLNCTEHIRLGSIYLTAMICRQVALKQIPVSQGLAQLWSLLDSPPRYGRATQCITSALISALICDVAFNGSIYNMCFAGLFGCLVALFFSKNYYSNDSSLSSFT